MITAINRGRRLIVKTAISSTNRGAINRAAKTPTNRGLIAAAINRDASSTYTGCAIKNICGEKLCILKTFVAIILLFWPNNLEGINEISLKNYCLILIFSRFY